MPKDQAPEPGPPPGPPPGAAAFAPPPRRVLRGILYMCLASALLFPVMNATAKTLGADYSSLQVSWARAFGHIVFLLALFLPRHGLALLHTKRLGLQMTRAALLFTSNLCFFFAIVFIPLAKAAAITLAAPLVVALLAGPMLGERTTPSRVAALLLGFAGVLIVIRPGTEVFHPAAIFVVVSACSYGLYQILTRRIANTDRPETSTVYSSVIGAFGMLLVLPFVWRTPEGLLDLGLFCSLGVLGALGHLCIARAFGFAPASVVSPFQYVQLLGSIAIGWLVFGDLPDALTWVGGGVIVASGVWIGLSQTRRRG